MDVRDSVRQARFSIRDISERAAAMDDVVRLDIGQPDFDTPDVVKERAAAAIEEERITYTSLWGIPPLRAKIADYESHKSDFSAENVMVTTGGTNALYNILATVLDHDQEVLMNDPAWSPYSLIARVAPGSFRQVPYVRDGALDVDGIREAVTDDTELLILNSPENPTGRVYGREELEALADLAEDEDLYVISDEVYDHILYDGTTHTSMAEVLPDRTFVVNSTSKNFAMTGWRLGWVVGPEDLIHELGKANRATTACPNFPAQHAALAALEEAQDATAAMVEEFAARKDLTMDLVEEVGWTAHDPDGAIYVFPETGRDSWDLAHALLEDAGVAVVPGEPHGTHSDTSVRICFGSADEDAIREGFDRIGAFLAEST